MKMYSIYDRKANCYHLPFFAPDKFTASRNFARMVNDTQVQISMFPEDFDLFEMGEFEGSMEIAGDHTKLFSIHEAPQFICGAVGFKNMQQKEVK